MTGLSLALAMAGGGWAFLAAPCAGTADCPMMAGRHAGCAGSAEIAPLLPCCETESAPAAPAPPPAVVSPAPLDPGPATAALLVASVSPIPPPAPAPKADVAEHARDAGLHALGLYTLFADLRL
ncbi:MAG: hypothetical protein U0X73_14225 [Thermoanaerobaculia bacterium]